MGEASASEVIIVKLFGREWGFTEVRHFVSRMIHARKEQLGASFQFCLPCKYLDNMCFFHY
jgi:hypothetical protein